MKNYIISEFTKTRDLFEAILRDENLQRKIEEIAKVCVTSLRQGKKIMRIEEFLRGWKN